MNYKKTFADFEKRYGEKCSAAFFAGKPLIFFSRPALTIGCCVSTGSALLVLPRSDGRLIAQASGSDFFLSCNTNEFKNNRDKRIVDLLLRAEKYGVSVGGAMLLFSQSTELLVPNEPLLFCAMRSFCRGAEDARELTLHFEKFQENTISVTSKKDRITVFDGKNVQYAPLPDSQVKIVLCHTGSEEPVKHRPEVVSAQSALSALSAGDIEKFGELLNRETEAVLTKNKLKQTTALFRTALKMGDAYGSGILEDGGIFSIVKNSRVDTFMHNLGSEYEKHFGSCPDFYVTRTEDSGISIPIP